jgi:hypothetical protein
MATGTNAGTYTSTLVISGAALDNYNTPTITNAYFAYIICMFLFNLIELAGTIYTAIETRKGNHIEWWFYGPLTNMICKS